jgi:hypothetical protein
MQCDITDSTKADKSCNALHQRNQTATPLFYFTTDKTCDITDLINDSSIQHQITAWEEKCVNNQTKYKLLQYYRKLTTSSSNITEN